ncbi:hypothetical protein ES708_15511 [subsurface metagenome]
MKALGQVSTTAHPQYHKVPLIMAKLSALPEQAIISGYRGVIDFYLLGGCQDRETWGPAIPCARSWPRSPGKRRSPAVEAEWSAFAYIAGQWNNVTQEVKDAFEKLSTGTGYSARDLFERAYLSGLYRYPH